VQSWRERYSHLRVSGWFLSQGFKQPASDRCCEAP